MNPIEQFAAEREEAIDAYSRDSELRSSSQDWLRLSMGRRYVYNFDWLGRPIIQYPQDMVAVQELIWETRPDLIIETGVAHGGSLILSASILAMLDYADAVERGGVVDPARPSRHVIGIDIDIRDHNRQAIEAHSMASRISLVQGSSIDTEIVEKVKGAIGDAKRVMVCLDSMHTHDHVLAELEAYAPLVSPDCYCIVFDSFVEDMPKNFFPDRPWDVGDNPKTAIHSWLKANPDFEIDETIQHKLQITVAPDGFLRRRK